MYAILADPRLNYVLLLYRLIQMALRPNYRVWGNHRSIGNRDIGYLWASIHNTHCHLHLFTLYSHMSLGHANIYPIPLKEIKPQ